MGDRVATEQGPTRVSPSDASFGEPGTSWRTDLLAGKGALLDLSQAAWPPGTPSPPCLDGFGTLVYQAIDD